jgi:hypothetical protein
MISLKSLLSASAFLPSVPLASGGCVEIRDTTWLANHQGAALLPDAETNANGRIGRNEPAEERLSSQNPRGVYSAMREASSEENVTLTLLEETGDGGPQFEAPSNLTKAFGFFRQESEITDVR